MASNSSSKEIVVSRRELERREQNEIDTELLKFIALDDIQVALNKINKSLKVTQFQGGAGVITLNADEKYRYIVLWHVYPYTPLFTAHFFNDGPDEVFVSVNGEADMPLKKGANALYDFIKAERKIEVISYYCDPGETASVRVGAKW